MPQIRHAVLVSAGWWTTYAGLGVRATGIRSTVLRRFMNHISRSRASSGEPDLGEDPVRPCSYVRHAIMDARAGLPILITARNGVRKIVALAAETATAASLATFQAAHRGEPVLVLAASRATALGHAAPVGSDYAAWHLAPALLSPQFLRALADPTQVQPEHAVLAPFLPADPGGLADTVLALAKLAHLLPAMLIGEAGPDVGGNFVTATAEDIAAYKSEAVTTLQRVAEADVPLAEAKDARLIAYRPSDGGPEHVALLIGRPEDAAAPLVRIHSECFTGDLLGSLRCDCGPQLHQAIRRMEAEGSGVLLYMAQEGRGIGLVNKLRAYALQDRGLDTLDANRALGWGADERSFAAAAAMLHDLGIRRIRLLTNNPDKVGALEGAGIEIAGRLRHVIAANGVNDAYLATKARRFGHLLG